MVKCYKTKNLDSYYLEMVAPKNIIIKDLELADEEIKRLRNQITKLSEANKKIEQERDIHRDAAKDCWWEIKELKEENKRLREEFSNFKKQVSNDMKDISKNEIENLWLFDKLEKAYKILQEENKKLKSELEFYKREDWKTRYEKVESELERYKDLWDSEEI